MTKYKCEECNELGARLKSALNIRLCDECNTSKKYKLITKTTVKDKYKLTDSDLKNIPSYPVKNPHFSCAAPMILYLEKVIFTAFINKYDSQNNFLNFEEIDEDSIIENIMVKINNIELEKYKKKYENIDPLYQDAILKNDKEIIKEFKQKMKDCEIKKLLLENNLENLYTTYLCTDRKSAKNIVNEMIEEERRKIELTIALENAGLEFRSDSQLYQSYIDNTSDLDLDNIIMIMKEMNWFYEYTDYRKHLKNIIKNQYKYYNYFDTHTCSNEAKQLTIKEWIKNGKQGVQPPDSIYRFS